MQSSTPTLSTPTNHIDQLAWNSKILLSSNPCTALSFQFQLIPPAFPIMAGPSIENDAFFHELPPLPEGWDWKRCETAAKMDVWLDLSEEQRALVHAHREARLAQWHAMCGADDAAAHRRRQLELRIVMKLIMPSPPGATAAAATPTAGGVDAKDDDEEEEYEDGDVRKELAKLKEEDFHLPEELAVLEHFGIPLWQLGMPLFEIAEVMHRQKCEYWGFTIFRVTEYGSAAAQARWDEFWRRWNGMMKDRLAELVGVGIKSSRVLQDLQETDEGYLARFNEMYVPAMAGGIMRRWSLVLREHEELAGMGAQDVRYVFREMLRLDEEEDESLPNRVPVGVDAGLALMVDESVVSSLLDEGEGRRPYIIGVLSDIDDDIPEEAEAVHFKIALESVVDLWRQIQVQHVYGLVPPEGKIYISPGVFEDDA